MLGLGRRLPVLKGTLIDERLVAQQVECSESLVSGRNYHAGNAQPSNLARRLFPAQVIKSAAMAHRVAAVVDAHPDDAVLVVCGSSHMAYGHGVPERVFTAHPHLRDASYNIFCHPADKRLPFGNEPPAADAVEAIFGSPGGARGCAADVAYVYDWEATAGTLS